MCAGYSKKPPMSKLAAAILRALGWKVTVTVPDYSKSIVCVAPHTSNMDFILGELAYSSVGRKSGFLMKDTWFVWPLGCFFRAIGGIAVPRRKKGSRPVTEVVTEKFSTSDKLTIAITPEGTRSRTAQWHTGFLRIAYQAKVPIVLGVIDAPTKSIMIEHTFDITGDIDTDMRRIKEFYKPYTGINPDNFTTE